MACQQTKTQENAKKKQAEQKTEIEASEKTEQTQKNSKLELLEEIVGLPNAESVVYDSIRECLYASVTDEEGGYIAKISLEGEILEKEFITGLKGPKGMVIFGNKIYVSNIVELVEADLNTTKIIKRHQAEGAEFLNDVTSDTDGSIYVSDMATSSIYKLDKKNKIEKWLDTLELENPNGLLTVGQTLYVASWGKFGKTDELARIGRFLKVDTKTKKIDKITNDALGSLDGLQVFKENSFLISDWKRGKIWEVSESGEAELFFKTNPHVGDILYIKNKKTLVFPFTSTNKILIYKLKEQ